VDFLNRRVQPGDKGREWLGLLFWKLHDSILSFLELPFQGSLEEVGDGAENVSWMTHSFSGAAPTKRCATRPSNFLQMCQLSRVTLRLHLNVLTA
jgi:hypothetical protein